MTSTSSTQKKSVVFLGTPDFAIPSLQALMEHKSFSVDLVITQPDRPVGRKQVRTRPPVKIFADKHTIPVWQPEKLNAEWKKQPKILHRKPDYLVVVAYGQILSQDILHFPKIAPVNVHASLLPAWRGASPIQHAILAGDHQTGVTIQYMVRELDAGPILAQRKIDITEQETFVTVHDTLAVLGADLLIETLNKQLIPKEQEHAQATFCKKLSRMDGEADRESMTAEEIDRKVRALVPWPGVQMMYEDQKIKVLETSLSEAKNSVPVPCAEGTTLYLLTLQPPGKKAMSAAEWERGLH